ncbi:hypothetical protein P8452_66534 [Trifolium repens]|nr:hypothetical protein P8452_66534 [Trifolium repens]
MYKAYSKEQWREDHAWLELSTDIATRGDLAANTAYVTDAIGYLLGLLIGLLIDSGDGVTHVVPVVDVHSFPRLTKQINVAGRHTIAYLVNFLSRYTVNRTVDFETIRAIKEKLCYISIIWIITLLDLLITRIMVPQLNCTDEDVIVGAVSIFKAIMLKPNHSQEDALINSRQANINTAHYDMCLMEVLKRLASENISQRRNAMDVIAEILHISIASKKQLPHSAWQETDNTLLERLGDKDI